MRVTNNESFTGLSDTLICLAVEFSVIPVFGRTTQHPNHKPGCFLTVVMLPVNLFGGYDPLNKSH